MDATIQASTPNRSRATRLQLPKESALALTCMAIVGLHVADDSFVHPEPGTSALDHLAGGLVPLTALGSAALAYRAGGPVSERRSRRALL